MEVRVGSKLLRRFVRLSGTKEGSFNASTGDGPASCSDMVEFKIMISGLEWSDLAKNLNCALNKAREECAASLCR